MALLQGCFGLVIGDIKRRTAMVEQRFQLVMKKRQPMLHALIARAVTDGGIKRIIIHNRAESLNISAPKAQNRLFIKVNFTGGIQC